MAELIDNNPVFMTVMGCDGAGKTAWKRANYDALPARYIDQDSIAGGFGDWDDQDNRDRTRDRVAKEIEDYIKQRLDFGMESTFSELPGSSLVDRVIGEGNRVCGVYIGTNSPDINISRIDYRVSAYSGHKVEAARIPQLHAFSLSNLRKYIETFDELELIDNSEEDDILHQPMPLSQAYVIRGEVSLKVPRDEVAPWCLNLIERLERSREGREQRRLARQRKLRCTTGEE